MADSSIGLLLIKKLEGGYINDPNDSGKETYCGITFKWFPDWHGWPIVHLQHRHEGEIIPALDILVSNFYQENFLNKLRYNEINDQALADKLLESAVLDGIVPAVRDMQQAAGITITGRVDDKTLAAFNNSNPLVV